MKHPFLFGAVGYPLLELAWRGRTHPSMILAGGLGCLSIDHIGRMNKPLWLKVSLAGATATGIEAACGLLWNRQHQVWDYRRMPLNWHGQVCVPYSAAWTVLSAAYMYIDKRLFSV